MVMSHLCYVVEAPEDPGLRTCMHGKLVVGVSTVVWVVRGLLACPCCQSMVTFYIARLHNGHSQMYTHTLKLKISTYYMYMSVNFATEL